ncbi:MAG: hypothetical protein GX900_00675 [Clostridiaceae bacterium]|nr:hypothetical protein [Clostridiaceae bacterium]
MFTNLDRKEDVFLEKIVKQKKKKIDYLIIIGSILGVFVLIGLVLLIGMLFPILAFLVPLGIAAVLYGAWRLMTMTNREYEYIVTNGALDIDLIINRQRRKRVLRIVPEDIELMTKAGEAEMMPYVNNERYKKLDATSGLEDADLWQLACLNRNQPTLVTFEPDSRMLEGLRRHSPSKVRYLPQIHRRTESRSN